ncbi:reverse transcriptase domain-containing protein [Tanacetum coccineum]
MPPKRTAVTTTLVIDAQIKALIAQGVVTALAEYEATRGSGNGDDSHDSRTGVRRQVPTACECTYSDFLEFQSLNFKGTKGVVGLTQWFKKIEYVFHLSNCTVACQIKFATYTLQGNALTWWNSHVKTVSHEVAYGMTWKALKKMMTDKYCSRGEIKKLETELWNLKVKVEKKLNDNSRRKQNQQQPFKRQIVARAYTTGSGEKRACEGSKPLCPKCNYHYDGQCAPKCTNYKRTGHLARDCRSQPTVANNQRALWENQRVLTCFECGAQGHYKRDCPKLKNKKQIKAGKERKKEINGQI